MQDSHVSPFSAVAAATSNGGTGNVGGAYISDSAYCSIGNTCESEKNIVSAPARFTKADIKRAVSGVMAAGLRVHSVEIDPNGKIVIEIEGATRPRKPSGWKDLE